MADGVIDPDRLMEVIEFAVERHRVWERRQAGAPQPWTMDPVLATKKFTNVYRVLDPGSQFVLTDLAEQDVSPFDVFARLFLYRYTNWPATWRYLREQLGRYPLAADMDEALTDLIHEWRDDKKQKVFSGAYMIIPQPGHKGDKVKMVVELARRATDIWPAFDGAADQPERIAVLRSLYGVGDFLAQQILTDWNYTSHSQSHPDIENWHVVPGPGSWKGGLHVAPGLKTVPAIEWTRAALLLDSRCPTLDGRPPSLMDVQNILCEFSKYVKGPAAGPYRPAHPGAQPPPVLPSHWRHT